MQITLQTPFPGTRLYESLKATERLLEDRPWRRCTLFDLVYQPSPMSAAELVAGFRDLARRLYGEEMTRWRRENFAAKYMRTARRADEGAARRSAPRDSDAAEGAQVRTVWQVRRARPGRSPGCATTISGRPATG